MSKEPTGVLERLDSLILIIIVLEKFWSPEIPTWLVESGHTLVTVVTVVKMACHGSYNLVTICKVQCCTNIISLQG